MKWLLDLFRPSSSVQEKEPSITVTFRANSSEGLQYTPEQARAIDLASQSVKLKDIQLSQAINLLEEAYGLWPENYEIAFRLARYLRKDGKGDDAFSIYRKLTLDLNPKDYLMFGFNREAILDEMVKQLFEEKKFKYFFYYHYLKLWNILFALAAQGRYAGVKPDIFMTYGAKIKIKKALKSLELLEQSEEIAKTVYEHLNNADPDLQKLSDISKANEFPSNDEVPQQGSLGQRHHAALAQNQDFTALYVKLAYSKVPDTIYKDAIVARSKEASDSDADDITPIRPSPVKGKEML